MATWSEIVETTTSEIFGDLEAFRQANLEEKLDLVMATFMKLHKSVDDKLEVMNDQILQSEEGLSAKVAKIEKEREEEKAVNAANQDLPNFAVLVDQVESNSSSISEMEELVSNVHSDNQFMKAVIQRQDRQITNLRAEVTDSKAKLMANNIVIIGVEGDDPEETCESTAIAFLREKMKMHLLDTEVISTHKQGATKLGKRPRPLVVKCVPSLRKRIFAYTKNLSCLRNSNNEFYYVNQQYPEQYVAERKENQDRIKPSLWISRLSYHRKLDSVDQ